MSASQQPACIRAPLSDDLERGLLDGEAIDRPASSAAQSQISPGGTGEMRLLR